MTDALLADLTAAVRGPLPSADEPSSWKPVDLRDVVNGVGIAPPALLSRTDGVALLYAGRVHWFQGEPESCKTWAVLVAAKAVLDAGGTVLWLDFEDDANGTVERLRALAVPVDAILDRFHFAHPEEPLMDRQHRITRGCIDLGDLLEAHRYDLAVVDGVTEAMTVEGLDLNSNADVAAWMRLLPKRLASTGAAVACIDHVTKSSEGRGRYAIGGQHKLAGVTGAAYSFTAVEPFGRGRDGVVTVRVEKDRPGHVRRHANSDGILARFELTSWPDEGVTARLLPPDSTTRSNAEIRARIVEHLTIYPKASKTALRVLGNSDQVDAELKLMVSENAVTVEQSGRSHLHSLVEP